MFTKNLSWSQTSEIVRLIGANKTLSVVGLFRYNEVDCSNSASLESNRFGDEEVEDEDKVDEDEDEDDDDEDEDAASVKETPVNCCTI